MALIQTRRTVSLGRSVYELAKDHVASINEKLCPWVEQLVIAELRRHGVKIQKHERAKRAEVDRACVAGRKVHRWRKIDDRVVECIHCCARGVVYQNSNAIRMTEARKIMEKPQEPRHFFPSSRPSLQNRPSLPKRKDPIEHPCRDEKCRIDGLHAEHL